MFACTSLHCNRNVKGAASGYSSTNSRHDNDGDVVERDISRGFRYEHEALIKAKEVSFIGLDAALDTGLLMMATDRQLHCDSRSEGSKYESM